MSADQLMSFDMADDIGVVIGHITRLLRITQRWVISLQPFDVRARDRDILL
jgi:hypothetical protein